MTVINRLAGPSKSSLTVNVMIITVGAVLLYSGVKRVNIVDAALGQIPKSGEGEIGAAEGAAPSSGEGNLPKGLGTFDGHPVSNWIIQELIWARQNGWRGHVERGYATAAEQEAAARSYGLEHYGSGGPQASNHRGINYPRGAIDGTNPEQLNAVLNHKPNRHLIWGGPVIGDNVHFSSNGH